MSSSDATSPSKPLQQKCSQLIACTDQSSRFATDLQNRAMADDVYTRSVIMGTARDLHDRQARSRHSPVYADPWGTWEELLLASAVQRYGITNWALISTELQSRTRASFTFTPEACQAEYQAIKLRFGVDDTREESGGTLWFEELRRLRVAHLKRELEKYDNSIG